LIISELGAEIYITSGPQQQQQQQPLNGSRESGSRSEHSTIDSRHPSLPNTTTRDALWGNLAPEIRIELKNLVDENRR
jgi:hypothetical protein